MRAKIYDAVETACYDPVDIPRNFNLRSTPDVWLEADDEIRFDLRRRMFAVRETDRELAGHFGWPIQEGEWRAAHGR